MPRHLPALAFLAIAAWPFLLAAPSAPAPADDGGGDGEVLIIVSPHRRELRDEYSRAFPEYMARVHRRRVRLSWRDPGGGTGAIEKNLAARYRQGLGPGADLFFGGGVRPHQQAKHNGYLDPVRLPAGLLAAIPAEIAGQPVYDPEGHWYGVALATFGIIYHGGQVRRLGLPPPKEWLDLGDPGYAGWLASGNPQTSGVVHACYQMVLQAYGHDAGWRLLARMAANTRVFGEGASVAPTEVAAGDAAAGMVIESYADTAMRNAENPALAYVRPADLTLMNADAISRLRDAPHPELAERFVEYCLSAEGQRLLYQPPGVDGQRHAQRRYPVRADAYDGPHAPADNPYAGASAFHYSDALAAERQLPLNDLAGTWFLDTHRRLAAAWRAVRARGMRAEEVELLTRPPLDDAEMRALGARWNAMAEAKDPALARERVEYRDRWAVEALARYRAVERGPAVPPAP